MGRPGMSWDENSDVEVNTDLRNVTKMVRLYLYNQVTDQSSEKIVRIGSDIVGMDIIFARGLRDESCEWSNQVRQRISSRVGFQGLKLVGLLNKMSDANDKFQNYYQDDCENAFVCATKYNDLKKELEKYQKFTNDIIRVRYDISEEITRMQGKGSNLGKIGCVKRLDKALKGLGEENELSS